MSFSGSGSTSRWVYDVFLSFRGEDTRKNFVSHLNAALCNVGVNTFLDDDKLDKGQMLQSELWSAIESSHITIVVFSKTYAKSSWCVHELVQIMEELGPRIVLPVFYDVDPSDVRHQKGAFAEDLEEGDGLRYNVVWGSQKAFTQAANLVGWDLRNYKNESKVVKEIVNTVLKRLDSTFLSITDFPVGLESRKQDVIRFLEMKSSSVRIVGIWGMGGSGKTTIAKVIYNGIHRNFEDRSFLANIREVWTKDRGPIELQKQLLLDILKIGKIKIPSIELGKGMIKERLSSKTALVVLDDVNKSEQLSALCGNCKWIGPGSVIIITTRDVRLLNVLKVDLIHKMKEMDDSESLELFSWHAFKEANPRKDFIEVSQNVVTFCGGLPLALEVLGSYLYERTEREWQSVLSKLKRIPNDQIQEKLKISFDGLEDDMEKDIFLDICCFFIGKGKAYVTEILNGCGLHADIGITVLIERSLLHVERNNKLGMHTLLRDMGREIVRELSPEKPEKRSQLWFHEDVLNVLTENIGTEDVKGLALKLPRASRVCFNTNAFQKMKRLRLLQLDQVELIGDYGYLSRNLRWVSWQGFPLKYVPNNFYMGNLVAFAFKHSNLSQVWREPQLLECLKILNLSHSRYLTNTPDFSKLPNLEELVLKDCPSLSKIHQSIGDLSSIVVINLKDCSSLTNLPTRIYALKSVKILILSGCSKIDKLEEDIVQMESLTTLLAENTAIKQVPFSIVRAKNIGYISLCGYEGLARNVFPSLIWSWMSPTMNFVPHVLPFESMCSSLVSVDVQNNNWSDVSPVLRGLSKLRSLWVQCHSKFHLTQDLQRILADVYDARFTELETTSYTSDSLKSLSIGMGSYHQVFNSLSSSMSQGLATSESGNIFLPGDNYPYWLAHTGEGHSVLFKVTQVRDNCIKGMILCVVYSSIPKIMAAECLNGVFIINHTNCTIQLYKKDTLTSFNDEDWQGLVSNLRPNNEVEILVAFGHGVTVKNTAVYLVYDDSIDMKMEPLLKPEKNDFGIGKRMRTS